MEQRQRRCAFYMAGLPNAVRLPCLADAAVEDNAVGVVLPFIVL